MQSFIAKFISKVTEAEGGRGANMATLFSDAPKSLVGIRLRHFTFLLIF